MEKCNWEENKFIFDDLYIVYDFIFSLSSRNIGLQNSQNDPYYAGTMAEGKFLNILQKQKYMN